MIVARSSGPRRAAPVLQLGVADVGAGGAQTSSSAARVELQTCRSVGEAVRTALLRTGSCSARLDEHGHRAGVAQDPGDLLGGGRLVDRHGHGAGEPDREVEQRPFVAGAGHDAHPVAGLDAGGDEALGQACHVGEEVGGTDVLPGAGRILAGKQGRVRCLLRLLNHQVGDVGIPRNVNQGRAH